MPWIGRGIGSGVGQRRANIVAGLRSLALTMVLLLVFGLVFASADRVFASYLTPLDLGLLPAQVVVGLLVALAAATLAHLALAPPPWADLTMRAGLPAGRAKSLLPVLALDALVLIFVLVQVSALLGGHRHVLETAGLTYAQYARQGFVQLVLATALTLVVMAVAARRAPRLTHRDPVISRAALGALCLGTLGVVASALRRLDLYVDAFGLTRTRLLVIVVELALAAVLLLVAAAGVRWLVAAGDSSGGGGGGARSGRRQPGRSNPAAQHDDRPRRTSGHWLPARALGRCGAGDGHAPRAAEVMPARDPDPRRF